MGPAAHARRSWSLKVYVVGLVLLFVVAAGANVIYQRRAAEDDARHAATADAGFGSKIAARDIAEALGLVRTTVATTAANPGVAKVFDAPADCTLSFAGAGEFGTGHLDIVGQDGAVACSSLSLSQSAGYAGATWLAGALEGPTLVGPVADARTGKQVVLAASPVTGKGAVVAFLDLDALGPGLASSLGGPRHLEFVVTSADNSVVLARSIDPARWVGASPASTSFAGANSQAEHRDLDGTWRLYGQATVDEVDWNVFAGAKRSEALAAANRLSNRQLVITLAGLIAFLAAAFVIYRRIARPISKLSAGVRAATARTSSGPISVAGPAEVSTLVDDFNHLIAAANRELEAKSQLAAIVESSADAIVGATLDGVVTTWNIGAESLYGYTADEMIGRTGIAMLTPSDRIDERDFILEQVREGGRVQQLETKRIRKDGSIVDVSMTISPISDANGEVIGASNVTRDMTDRNRAETDRRALEDRLHQSERLESLGQLAGGIAHDFNNLLAAIMNYAAFVAEETADKPAVHADVEQIQIAAERAARLTKQLLIFGRRETIQPETLDLNAIVADIHNLLSRSIGEHINLIVEPASNISAILADRGQIEQVLVNLAVNARDAMPRGGTLTIETNAAELDDGYTRLHPDISPGHYVELAVSDTGTGMSQDVAGHIFEPFFTTKPAGEGTGLGLATVYGIVVAAGGSMSVYSEEGIGTTFRLYFPATDTPASTAHAGAAAPRGQGQTILVVEDDPAVLEITSRILRHNGYVVREAATFEEAIAHAAAHDFQLLLTDSVMPEMSGRTLAERVEELKPGRAVLYMSGYSPGVIGPQRILEHGVALIQKPFNQRALLEKVHAVLTASATTSSDPS
jgi:PAS domain S-box-containing protein